MVTKRMVTGALVMILMLVGMSIAVPSQAQQPPGGATGQTMWCNLQNDMFYNLCTDQEFMKGLTADQKKAIDQEWERRVPSMTPAERAKYYPEGRRYGSSMGAGG